MPKILINERDLTNPGDFGSYSNYTVLIAGHMPRTAAENDSVKPDSNGVYEFSKPADFIETIGLSDVELTTTDGQTILHYGNQMAHELLKIGYSIIYLPIKSAENVKALADAKTWEIFKDKASYDFRFIVHGLLASNESTRIDTLENALASLDNLKIIEKGEDGTYTVTTYGEDEYQTKFTTNGTTVDIPGIIDPETKEPYTTAKNALDAISTELSKLKSTLITTATINDANEQIAAIAGYDENDTSNSPSRGDCIALIELDEKSYLNTASSERPEIQIIDAINEVPAGVTSNGKFCCLTVPSVVYKNISDVEYDNKIISNKKMPGSFHYLACFMNSLRLGFREWYAAAGYTRGVSAYTVDYTTVKLGEIAINHLEPRNKVGGEGKKEPAFACNVIANFRGSYYLWGNRTAETLGTVGDNKKGDLVASHFLNIRQLCTTIKKQLYIACRRFTFDPNSDTLWFNFVNAIKPTLELMKADQGIRDYKILKIQEANPKKATLKARIRIIPVEAVEDFDLEISLEDSFGETAAVVSE